MVLKRYFSIHEESKEDILRVLVEEHDEKEINNAIFEKFNNDLNDNFYRKEFQELWNCINHKYAYTVKFDSAELIEKAVNHIEDANQQPLHE